ncbi:MAG: hypothetical protein KBT06_11690 [Prevotellaceae bacterium]|nr:hypothetical protein [Candidatus Colivivens equi]
MKKIVLFCIVLFSLFTMNSCIKEDDLTSDDLTSSDSYIKIQQDDLQDWDFGIASERNNVVLVKENGIEGFSHVLFLLYQTEDTISLTYQSDTLTDFYYNSYHFMVSRMDSLLLFTAIDGNMAVSYAIPYCEQVAKSNSKGIVSTLLDIAVKTINHIFDVESGIDMLREIENGDRESFMHDMGEFLAEQGFGALPYGSFGVLSYELYKHYLDRLHNKAIQFHIGNASCMIQSVQQNESDNTIEVVVSIENGEDIPNEYTWKNFWGQQVSSPNYIYYGVLCRAGNNYPTLQKYDYYQKELLEPHASLTHTFSFPLLAAEKLLFRSFLGFNYDYHNTALQDGYRKTSLAKYGNVVEFHPEFEVTTISNPLEGGTITGGGRYAFNTQVTLTATANNGYEFTHWNDGIESSTRTITVEGDATYTAYFEEEPPSLPDLSGTWTFNQTYFSDNSLQLNMQLENSTATSATYRSSWSGFTITLTANIDGSMSIGTWAPTGYTGSFSGTFNSAFTYASGNSYYYGTPSWANPGWIVEDPWSFSR